MKFTVLTLFPEPFDLYMGQTIIQRAVDSGIIEYEIVNIRDFSGNKHFQVDDIPFGGGAGMVLKPESYWNYFNSRNEQNPEVSYTGEENQSEKKLFTVFVSPQGKKFDQEIIEKLMDKEEVIIISGRYEGLDQRVIDKYVDEEVSIGDFVLSSGDLPALCIMDSVIRQKEGVIKKESFETDSFYNGLLGFPQYTRPVEIEEMNVPDVLRSGNHKQIDEYRLLESLKKTYKNRKDLLEEKLKDSGFKKIWDKYKEEVEK